jgi:hypothetical protein
VPAAQRPDVVGGQVAGSTAQHARGLKTPQGPLHAARPFAVEEMAAVLNVVRGNVVFPMPAFNDPVRLLKRQAQATVNAVFRLTIRGNQH